MVFDKNAFMKDYSLLITLRPIFNQINELAESIQKTFTAVGSDAMVGALEVYSAVKQNKDKISGLAVVANVMGVFFKRIRGIRAKAAKQPVAKHAKLWLGVKRIWHQPITIWLDAIKLWLNGISLWLQAIMIWVNAIMLCLGAIK